MTQTGDSRNAVSEWNTDYAQCRCRSRLERSVLRWIQPACRSDSSTHRDQAGASAQRTSFPWPPRNGVGAIEYGGPHVNSVAASGARSQPSVEGITLEASPTGVVTSQQTRHGKAEASFRTRPQSQKTCQLIRPQAAW